MFGSDIGAALVRVGTQARRSIHARMTLGNGCAGGMPGISIAGITSIPAQKRRKSMTRLLMLAIASMFALSACNTMSGLGEDIEAGGDKLERSAEKNKRY